MSVLVIDVGSSSVRAGVVDEAGFLHDERRIATPPHVPAPGVAEFDPLAIAAAARATAEAALGAAGRPVAAVGIANQRASTLLWRRDTGEPVGPGLSWQDFRTLFDCLELQNDGLRLAPNQPATKAAHLLAAARDEGIPAEELCVGTLDSWLVHNLTAGAEHLTDATNAAVTGLTFEDRVVWNPQVAERLGIPPASLPRIVDSSGPLVEATTLPGRPPICGLVGDQQAALVGTGCVGVGDVKITFGTGANLNVCLGPGEAPPFAPRGPHGTFPIVAWQRAGRPVWGIEAMMLSAGSSVQWLCDLGLLATPSDSHVVAAADSGGVTFVPAPLGLGAPYWDFGARSSFTGVTMCTGAPHLVRATLEGVAQRGADLFEAAQADSGLDGDLAEPVIDGGMSNNPTFTQALADALGRPVHVAAETECTALGAAYLAGLGAGIWRTTEEVAALRAPRATFEPRKPLDRDRWRAALETARTWHPDLSTVAF